MRNSYKWYDLQYEEERNLKRKTVTMFSLLDYLEKNHLIYLYKLWEPIFTFSSEIPFVLNTELYIKNHLNKFSLFKGNSFEYFFEKINYEIIPSFELIEFVDNNFEDKEQLRHNKNLCMQWLAIIVALLLGVVSVFDDKIKDWFGLAKNNNSVKQQVNNSNSDTLIDNQRQVIIKNLTDSSLLKSKLSLTDTTIKQISVDSLKKILPRDTQKK